MVRLIHHKDNNSTPNNKPIPDLLKFQTGLSNKNSKPGATAESINGPPRPRTTKTKRTTIRDDHTVGVVPALVASTPSSSSSSPSKRPRRHIAPTCDPSSTSRAAVRTERPSVVPQPRPPIDSSSPVSPPKEPGTTINQVLKRARETVLLHSTHESFSIQEDGERVVVRKTEPTVKPHRPKFIMDIILDSRPSITRYSEDELMDTIDSQPKYYPILDHPFRNSTDLDHYWDHQSKVWKGVAEGACDYSPRKLYRVSAERSTVGWDAVGSVEGRKQSESEGYEVAAATLVRSSPKAMLGSSSWTTGIRGEGGFSEDLDITERVSERCERCRL